MVELPIQVEEKQVEESGEWGGGWERKLEGPELEDHSPSEE